MIKLLFIAIVGIAIWGGIFGAFNVKDNNGNISIDINKEKVYDSIEQGTIKVKNVVDNIDQLSKEN